MASPATFRLAVIGSGPIGKLLVSSSIVHPNLEIVQYESDNLPLRPAFGYGVGPQALRGFRAANEEIGKAVSDGCIKTPIYMRFYHGGEEDRLLAEPQMPPNLPHGWIGRDELLGILDSRMTDVKNPIQYGKQLLDITKKGDRLQLSFRDGTQDTVDAICGCDGINSVCRKAVQSDEFKPPTYTGRVCFRGKVPSEEVVARLGLEFTQWTYMFVGVDGWHILTFPIHGGKLVNIAAFTAQPEYTPVSRDAQKPTKQDILARFPGHNKTAGGMLEMMVDLTPGGCQRLDLMHLGQLGRLTSAALPITLFGDAANAMTPHIAGSMSTGIIGAATFIQAWNSKLQHKDGTPNVEVDIAKAFKDASEEYEEKHKPLAQDLLNRSLEQGGRWSGAVTDADKLMEHPNRLFSAANHLEVAS